MEEQNIHRRLAAILAADVVDYTRLMEADTDGTVSAWKSARDNVIEPMIKDRSGLIIKFTGDGFLVEFPSVQNAVSCAIQLQEKLASSTLDFRIGINLGDIVDDGKDIHGEGVNIAARLEALAEPGGISISGNVYEQVRNRIEANFKDCGEQQVKNVSRPVQVYAICPETVSDPTTERVVSFANKPAIAVLPFMNMSGDLEQEYFSDGITEDIITELSRNRTFSVTSRNTVFTYKGASVEIPQVGKDLGVRYVLEGSVRKVGNRVRITGQLIEAATDTHIWSERYDRELEDIFAVQDEITQNIIGAIAPGIISAEAQRAHSKKIANLDAWDYVMRAHWHIRRFNKEDMVVAKELLNEAIDLEPRNATAYTDIAFAHHFDAVFGWSEAPEESHKKLGEAAQKAVELDGKDAYAHTVLAIYELFSSRHDDAIQRLKRAKDIDPNLSFACGYLGTAYAFSGDWDNAQPNLDEAIRLSPRDPLSVIWRICLGWAALLCGRHEEAVAFSLQAIHENPNFADNYSVLTAAYGLIGDEEKAKTAKDELLKRMPGLIIGDPRLQRPFRKENDRQHFFDGLLKAGLQES